MASLIARVVAPLPVLRLDVRPLGGRVSRGVLKPSNRVRFHETVFHRAYRGFGTNGLCLQKEHHVVEEVVRLAEVALAEVRQLAPHETLEAQWRENTVDEAGDLTLQPVPFYRQVLRRLVVTPFADLHVRAEGKDQRHHQPTARAQG